MLRRHLILLLGAAALAIAQACADDDAGAGPDAASGNRSGNDTGVEIDYPIERSDEMSILVPGADWERIEDTSAELRVYEDHIEGDLTSTDLIDGGVYTFLWLFVNKPEECELAPEEEEFHCDILDVNGGEGDEPWLNVGASLVAGLPYGHDGLPVGSFVYDEEEGSVTLPTLEYDENGEEGIVPTFEDVSLDDVLESEIHMHLRYKGLAFEDEALREDQLSGTHVCERCIDERDGHSLDEDIGDPDAEFECAGVTEGADADADPPEWYVGVPANNESHPIKPVCANVQGAGFAPAIEIIEDD